MQASGTPADGAGLGSASSHPPCCQPTTRWPGQRPPLQRDPAPAPCPVDQGPGAERVTSCLFPVASYSSDVFRGRSHRRNPPVVHQKNERGPVCQLPVAPHSHERSRHPDFLSQCDFAHLCRDSCSEFSANLGKSGAPSAKASPNGATGQENSRFPREPAVREWIRMRTSRPRTIRPPAARPNPARSWAPAVPGSKFDGASPPRPWAA